MYIPITVGHGIVETTFTPKLSGDYTADCQMIVSGVTYEVGEIATVRRGTEIKLRAEALEDREFHVTLDNVIYVWYVKKPTTMEYVEDGGFYKLVGPYTELNVGENTLTLQEGAGSDDLVIPDYGNGLILSVDITTGNFRSTSVPGLLDIAISPSYAFSSVPVQICALLRKLDGTGCIIVVFDSNLNELWRQEYNQVPMFGINSLCSTAEGFVCTLTDAVRNIIVSYTGQYHELAGGYAARNVKAGRYVLRVRPTARQNAQGYDNLVFTTGGSGRFSIYLQDVLSSSVLVADTFLEQIVVIDQTSGIMTIREPNPNTSTKEVYIGGYGSVSSVLIDSDLSVLVGFFDQGIKRFRKGVFAEQVSEVGTSYMVRTPTGIIYTRLHANAIVNNVKQDVVTLTPSDVARNSTATITFNYSAEVGGPAAVVNDLGEVTVDGSPFTGMLPAQCQISFSMPGTEGYYHFRKMGIVGAKAYEWDVLSEPQLNMDTVTLPPRYDAQIRTYEYEEVIISGITEGYEEEILSLSENVDIQVNDGEWSNTAFVTTKDKVVVRWFLEKYSAHYSPNNEIQFVRTGATFATWYVLKMGLDGVEMQKGFGETFNANDTWNESEIRIPVAIGSDAKRPTSTIEHNITPSIPYVRAPFGIATNAEMAPSVDYVKTFTLSFNNVVLPQTNYSHHFSTIEFVHSTKDEEIDITSEVGAAAHAAEVDTKARITNAIKNEEVGTIYDVAPAALALYAKLGVGLNGSTQSHWFGVGVDYTSQNLVSAPMPAGRLEVDTNLVGVNADVDVKVAARYVPVGVYVDVLKSSGWSRVLAPKFEQGSGLVGSYVDIDSVVLSASSDYEWALSPNVSALRSYSLASIAAHKVSNSKGLLVDLGYSLTRPQTSHLFWSNPDAVNFRIVEVATESYVIPNGLSVTFVQDAGVSVGTSICEVTPTVKHRPSTTSAVEGIESEVVRYRTVSVGTTAMFRESNIRDVPVDLGLFTEEQALDEADYYAEEGTPSVVAVGDSFIVRTAPLLGETECAPGELVGVASKVFGYLGGG